MQQWLARYVRHAPVTAVIIAANVLVFAVTAVQARSLSNVHATDLGAAMILWGPLTAGTDFGFLRVITAAFLHLDAAHLAMNMFLLLLIGREIEQFIGSRLYSVVYLAGAVGSSAAVLWMDPIVPTAGASGAIYGLMAVLVGVMARQGGDLRAPLVLVGVNVVYSLIIPGISLWGHLGGLVAGALLAWPVTARSILVRWVGGGVGVLGASALIWWRLVGLSTLGVSL